MYGSAYVAILMVTVETLTEEWGHTSLISFSLGSEVCPRSYADILHPATSELEVYK